MNAYSGTQRFRRRTRTRGIQGQSASTATDVGLTAANNQLDFKAPFGPQNPITPSLATLC